jgi:hypothetical protein
VLTIAGPTPDAEHPTIPTAVREWCINTAAVNPATHSIFTPSEDGHIYRWDLATNSLSQAVQLTAGIGEPYVPTVIGPDGTVYTLNGGTLFALGNVNGVRINLSSSAPGDRAVVAGQPLSFTAAIANPGSGGTPTGTVTFQDTVYFVAGPDDLQSTTTVLAAGVALDGTGHASCSTAALSAGTHFITVLYSGDVNFSPGSMLLVQRIHDHASSAALASLPNPSLPGRAVTFTATVSSVPPGAGTPVGMVAFQEGFDALAQVPLDGAGAASFSTSALSPGSHIVTAIYGSEARFASSSRSLLHVVQNGQAPVIGLQPIASSLGSVTSITNAGDSRLFLTSQSGQVLIFNGGSPFASVPRRGRVHLLLRRTGTSLGRVPPAIRFQRPPVPLRHQPLRRHRDLAIPALAVGPERGRSDEPGGAPDDPAPDQREPQRRAAPVRSRRLPLHRHGRRRLGRRSPLQRSER